MSQVVEGIIKGESYCMLAANWLVFRITVDSKSLLSKKRKYPSVVQIVHSAR